MPEEWLIVRQVQDIQGETEWREVTAEGLFLEPLTLGDINRKKSVGFEPGEKSVRDTEVGEKSLDRYL